jgi:hypothetical protein
MVDIPEKYWWSSYAYYVGKKKNPDWLTIDFILGYVNGIGPTPQNRYKEFVSERCMENTIH